MQAKTHGGKTDVEGRIGDQPADPLAQASRAAAGCAPGQSRKLVIAPSPTIPLVSGGAAAPAGGRRPGGEGQRQNHLLDRQRGDQSWQAAAQPC